MPLDSNFPSKNTLYNSSTGIAFWVSVSSRPRPDTGEVILHPLTDTQTGICGAANVGTGVWGTSDSGSGVSGQSNTGSGILGQSQSFDGVHGESQSSLHAGVSGTNEKGGYGVYGRGTDGPGVRGESSHDDGIQGTSSAGGRSGVAGTNNGSGQGVWGQSQSGKGVVGKSESGPGVYGSGTPAGHFEGDIEVTGDVLLGGMDCAEDFDVADPETALPGTVMVMSEAGKLEPSRYSYDRKVAGVVSGAGSFRPGLILGREKSTRRRTPIALIGKVYCRVDADLSPIAVGDLLTTSSTVGHAMKATDPARAFGSVIGKALGPLASGQGLIPVMVALQ